LNANLNACYILKYIGAEEAHLTYIAYAHQ